MLNINKHKFFLVQVLKDIYSDIFLANNLGFKGGTALALFYDLPRFSVDLDFNLLDAEVSDQVYDRLCLIAAKYGRIKDEAKKHFGLIIVIDYGGGERNLKIETSNRLNADRYEIKNYLGISVKVMQLPDMFAHKLCALLDRDVLINRDIFDCYFLMQRRTPVNKRIVEDRMKLDFDAYLEKCIAAMENVSEKRILSGLGELMDEDMKTFVKNKLKSETINLFKLYRQFPIID
jgi:predicted nucleotidyltransferase component of viral defense system